MKPLQIAIGGRYWDSYVYQGRLYLFTLEGSVLTIDWDRLIGEWKLDVALKLALRLAFTRSDLLYKPIAQDLVSDYEVRGVIKRKFQKLANTSLQVSQRTLRKFQISEQDNPLPFPHSDLEIYYKKIYAGAKDSLTWASCNKATKYGISTRLEKLWDGPVLDLSASYFSLAIAAGSEGLFETQVVGASNEFLASRNDPIQRLKDHCLACEWTYHDIFTTGNGAGNLIQYEKLVDSQYANRTNRVFKQAQSSRDFFQSLGFTWGAHDKIYQITEGRVLKALKYSPWMHSRVDQMEALEEIQFQSWKGAIVAAAAMPFGIILELENALVVAPSSNVQPTTFRTEPTNWRVFPRSRHYENQLHVVGEEDVSIYSFNHDYLVDQDEKVIGTARKSRQERRV